MKKSIFFATLGLITVFFAVSCSKSDTVPPASTTIEGKWVGNQNSGVGSALFYFSLDFKANGILVASANSAVNPDIANGTWSLAGDSVRATYTYAGSSITHSLAGKFSSASNVITGTIGLGTNTAGLGFFTVVKQ